MKRPVVTAKPDAEEMPAKNVVQTVPVWMRPHQKARAIAQGTHKVAEKK